MSKFSTLSALLLDDALAKYRLADSMPPPTGGWARSIREALGMTRDQLARRLDVSISTINTLERNEARGKISLDSLQRLARGMDCHVVYAIVPNSGKTLQAIMRERAQSVAQKQMGRVSHTMNLEKQGLNKKQEQRQLQRLVESLLAGNHKRLWR
jgi:predicted DNA-binding mobile mystery protein A